MFTVDGADVNPAGESRTKVNDFGETEVQQISQHQKHSFTPDETYDIIRSYQSGLSIRKIAEEYGCCKTTISKLLKEHGVNVTGAKQQARLQDDQVVSMYEQMYTSVEIGERFGVSHQAVIACLKRNGVPLRTRWDYCRK